MVISLKTGWHKNGFEAQMTFYAGFWKQTTVCKGMNNKHDSWGSVCVLRGVLRKSDQMLEVDIMLPKEGLFAPLSGSWMLDTTLYSLPPWSNTYFSNFSLGFTDTYEHSQWMIHSLVVDHSEVSSKIPLVLSKRKGLICKKKHKILPSSFFNIHHIA